MKKLRIVLGVQLAVFVLWGGWLFYSRGGDGAEFCLETRPVDPRDLISGTYVALNYDISTPAAEGCAAFAGGYDAFYVRLEDRGRTALTPEGAVAVYEAAACAAAPGPEYGWAKAEPQRGSWRRGAALYGIERFYLNENDPRKDARSGSVIAKVKIGRDRRLALLDLVRKI
jgi:hypothetical protein